MSEESKPPIRCPLCGKIETVKEEEDIEDDGHMAGPVVQGYEIKCIECGLTLYAGTKEEARTKWNKRAPMKIVFKQKGIDAKPK